jgi:hypothetical protein
VSYAWWRVLVRVPEKGVESPRQSTGSKEGPRGVWRVAMWASATATVCVCSVAWRCRGLLRVVDGWWCVRFWRAQGVGVALACRGRVGADGPDRHGTWRMAAPRRQAQGACAWAGVCVCANMCYTQRYGACAPSVGIVWPRSTAARTSTPLSLTNRGPKQPFIAKRKAGRYSRRHPCC